MPNQKLDTLDNNQANCCCLILTCNYDSNESIIFIALGIGKLSLY